MDEKPTGVIAKSMQDGHAVVWRFLNEMPTEEIRSKLPHLVVIAWHYDKTLNDGMPTEVDNERMIALEDTIENSIEESGFCQHASSSTGNGKKEFCYYVADLQFFMSSFNEALVGHERYPLDINFHEDPEWEDFSKTLKMIT